MAYIGNSPAGVGNYQVVDDISSTFNGVLTSFALTASSLAINPAKSGQLLVSINGVLQEPDDTGTEGFKVSGSNIVFSSAPATGSTFWAVWQGQAVDIGTPSDGTVGTDQLSATGTKSGSTYLAGDNTWKTVVTDLVNDTTPQLGGNLDLNGHVITGLSTDPTMGGDLSGTASNAQLGANTVTDTELNSAKLNGIATSANNYTHPGTHPASMLTGALPAIDGSALTGVGKVLQVVQGVKSDTSSTAGTSWVTLAGLSAQITPVSSTSKILVQYQIWFGQTLSHHRTVGRLRRVISGGSTAYPFIGDTDGSRSRCTWGTQDSGGIHGATYCAAGSFLDTPSTTSAVTYDFQWSGEGGTAYINRGNEADGNNSLTQRLVSSIILTEIGA